MFSGYDGHNFCANVLQLDIPAFHMGGLKEEEKNVMINCLVIF